MTHLELSKLLVEMHDIMAPVESSLTISCKVNLTLNCMTHQSYWVCIQVKLKLMFIQNLQQMFISSLVAVPQTGSNPNGLQLVGG